MRKLVPYILFVFFLCPVFSLADDGIRIKDIGKLQGWRENALVGYGIVTGLAGTGDSPNNRTMHQAMSNVLAQFNLNIPQEQIQSRNVAVVMVTALLPAFAREGDTLDVTVTSAGDARSLVGGSLLLTPLQGPNGRVYALSQGALSVGGYRYDANGNVIQKNHPTVGSIPNGATVEVGISTQVMNMDKVTFVLQQADYTTADRVANAINSQLGLPIAEVKDATGIEIKVPENNRQRLASFLARVENVKVEPDRRAKIVINERTGTIVSGGDVKISKVVVSLGDLKVSIKTENTVSQPYLVNRPGSNIRTQEMANSRIDIEEQDNAGYIAPVHNTVADLVQAMTKLKIQTRDIISVLRSIKAAGALHADLIIQ